VQLPEHERARAVDGIDDPGVRAGSGFEAVLLAENPVIRIRAADLAADRRFGFAVRDRHRIEAAVLALVLQADGDAKARQDLLAGQIREMHRKFDELG
jgi:hypothetical protein